MEIGKRIFPSIVLPDEFYLDLELYARESALRKGEYFLKSGEVCENIGFVKKGFLEGYHHNRDKEFVTWFWKENEFPVGIRSFLKQEPAYISIKAVEDCELLLLSFQNLQILYEKYPTFNRLSRKLLEEALINMAEIAPSLRIYSAKERYELLLKQHPEVYKRASLKSISSYLGITQETLSRIRKQR